MTLERNGATSILFSDSIRVDERDVPRQSFSKCAIQLDAASRTRIHSLIPSFPMTVFAHPSFVSACMRLNSALRIAFQELFPR